MKRVKGWILLSRREHRQYVKMRLGMGKKEANKEWDKAKREGRLQSDDGVPVIPVRKATEVLDEIGLEMISTPPLI